MTHGALEDSFVYNEFQNLIQKFNVKKVIETGTYHGWSTVKLSDFEIDVITIESSKENFEISSKSFNELQLKNVTPILGSSPEVLEKILTENEDNTILFLDAHWYDYWPIHDELRVCINKKIKPIIIIHDFFVPDGNGGAVFGFDQYRGQKLDLDYIKSFLDEIYGEEKYTFYYNTQSDKVGQGVIYIHKSDE